MTEVRITYCKPCGYLSKAQQAAAEVSKVLGIECTLVPGKGGVFEVHAGDSLLIKRSRTHFPTTGEVVAAVAKATKTSKGPS